MDARNVKSAAAKSGPIRLHLGCQEKYLEGYINIDLPQSEHSVINAKVDLYADVRELAYPKGSVDEVRSHHLLEHFSRQEALLLLSRWHSWLKVGGLVFVETPDFEESAKKFLRVPFTDQFLLARHIFGSHEADWAYHRDFWSEDKFRYVLGELGYGDFRFEKFSNNLESKLPALRGSFVAKKEGLLKKLSPIGFNALPNIVCYARKVRSGVKYYPAIKRILKKSLAGRESKILDVWMEDIPKNI